MTGRGDGRLIRPSPNPSVIIGLSLGLSSSTVSASSPSPLFITVSARILTTPHPASPITLLAHPTALSSLSNRSFNNIVCTGDHSKYIEIFPRAWLKPHFDPEDLRSAWSFPTVPAQDSGGVLTVSHEVPNKSILAAGLVPGERYRVSLTDKCLGAEWWTFKGEEELEGKRLAVWRSEEEITREEEEREEVRAEIRGEVERGQWTEDQAIEFEREEGWLKDGPAEMGEEPSGLAMVAENEIEFEVV